MRKPRRRVRRIEPLPKMYALQYTSPKATWDCGKCTSEDHLSQRVLRMQATNLVLKRKKQVFSGSDDGRLEQRRMDRAIHWFLHKFNVDLKACGYSPSIQSRSLLDVPCHCSGPTSVH